MTTSTEMEADQAMAAVKAATLIESLPWLKSYSGQIVVVKFGGNAMVDDDLKRAFAEDMVYLRYAGVRPVVVHGGGPQISAALERRGIRSEFRGGYRVTTTEAIDVVREVLDGQVTRELVDLIDEHGPMAAALPGDRDSLFSGPRRSILVDGDMVDLGHVGDIANVDPTSVLAALDRGLIPVVSSIAASHVDPAQTLNINADAAAAALAIALGAAKLVMLTDVAGLYRDWPDRTSLVEQITVSELTTLLPTLQSGMIPKMSACLDAIGNGVGAATIVDGRVPHAILLEIFTRRGSGTEVVPDDRRPDDRRPDDRRQHP